MTQQTTQTGSQGKNKRNARAQEQEAPPVGAEGTTATETTEQAAPQRSAEEQFLEIKARRDAALAAVAEAQKPVDACDAELAVLAAKIKAKGATKVVFGGEEYEVRKQRLGEALYFHPKKERVVKGPADGKALLV